MLHPEEISTGGKRHEADGPGLLVAIGVSPYLARFANTHGSWSPASRCEDLLVSLSDQIWKGRRDQELANLVTDKVARMCHREPRFCFLELDHILAQIASHAEERLEYSLKELGVVVGSRKT